MNLLSSQLRQIIKEEIDLVLNERMSDDFLKNFESLAHLCTGAPSGADIEGGCRLAQKFAKIGETPELLQGIHALPIMKRALAGMTAQDLTDLDAFLNNEEIKDTYGLDQDSIDELINILSAWPQIANNLP